ncbi:MAG: YbhB/YbcL family Raf kinase inhibitor-like protein [Anaerolineae bacterium]|nr:YbhB/YbcL family Raf kinase inhibitor-like protein [Anaerolineae bacterium]
MHRSTGLILTLCPLIGLGALLAACSGHKDEAADPEVEQTFELTSAAFAEGDTIPKLYTCRGDDITPPLAWGSPPDGTASFALFFDDPDAPGGTWVHWVLINLPADMRALPEAVTTGTLPEGTLEGVNSWGRRGYGGPCPPSGTHRYFFKLYALDTTLDLSAGAKKAAVIDAMEGHILAEGRLMGTASK